jgi:hypothetical protein
MCLGLSAVLVDQRHLHQRLALHHAFFDCAGEIEMIRRFLELVFNEAGNLVDLVNRLDRVLLQRRGENRGRGRRFTIRGFFLNRQTREDHGPKQDQHQHAERGDGEQGTAARHGRIAAGFGFALVGEAELAHRVARSLVPANCNCASVDCANFMGGCMVTKVPVLLRRGRERGVVPDHPQVIGYVSILLNATGLRKGPRIGYTRARQTASAGRIRSRRGQPWGRSLAVVFEYFIGLRNSGVPGLSSCMTH